MEQKKQSEQLKRFQFFSKDQIKDQQSSHTSPALNDLDIFKATYIDPRIYFASRKEHRVYFYEENKVTGFFDPFNDQLQYIDKGCDQGNNYYLITIGIDEEINKSKIMYVKFWNVISLDPNKKNKNPQQSQQSQLQQQQQQTQQQQSQQYQEVKKIQIGRPNEYLKGYFQFAVAPEMNSMVFGCTDGKILLYKSQKNLLNESKEGTIMADSKQIKRIFFSKFDQNLHLFFTTDEGVYVYQELQKRKKIFGQGGSNFGITPKGTLVGVPQGDNKNIYEFDINNQKPINTWNLEGEKIKLKTFKNNYILLVQNIKSNSANSSNTINYQFTIFDMLNNYTAFSENFQNIQKIIPADNFIYLINLNQNQNQKDNVKSQQDLKSLFKLTEKENQFKIETFFKRSFFDVAYRFAKNQNSDPTLLAEISRLHGDHLYAKGEYQTAIGCYIQTAGYIEPSYIIRKFLDVSHIDFLIQYLEALHKKKPQEQNFPADKHHTALLLNCYVKQKAIPKLEEFLKKQNFEQVLFDNETAIKVCRELQHFKLALLLAEKNNMHEIYLDILIENIKNYEDALKYIKEKLNPMDKVKHIMLFGQTLMKNKPDETLDLIKNMVRLELIINKLKSNKANQQDHQNISKQSEQDKQDQAVLEYLNIKEMENLPQLTLRQPDEYLHLFVVNIDQLEKYLIFLRDLPNLKNVKAIFHRLFEFYLEQYHQIIKKKDDSFKFRKSKGMDLLESESQIIKMLKDDQYKDKYDKNHLLVLFKMYNFAPGIIHLCEELNLREELLNFYISNKEANKIIELCNLHGKTETNLWVQALKYFAKQENQAKDKLPEILIKISALDSFSPLLVLNILAKDKNIEFKLIKQFFTEKLKKDREEIQKDQKVVEENMKHSAEYRQEYQKLKTTAKIFSSTKCVQCEANLTVPSVHYRCGHSYHENCLMQEKAEKECLKCFNDQKIVLERKEQYDQQATDTKSFFENMSQNTNKFDVVSEYLGRGLFKFKNEQ